MIKLFFISFSFILYSCNDINTDDNICLTNVKQIIYKNINFDKIQLDTSNYIDNYYYEDSNKLDIGYGL